MASQENAFQIHEQCPKRSFGFWKTRDCIISEAIFASWVLKMYSSKEVVQIETNDL